MTPPAPRPTERKGPKRGTLFTDDGDPIEVSLTTNDENVLVSGPADSLLVPVHGLVTTMAETGPVARQVVADATLQHAQQIQPGIGGLVEGDRVVINGVTFEIVDIHDNGIGRTLATETQMTVKPVDG